jgi:NitT/TauT family transport system substrate-binding protein
MIRPALASLTLIASLVAASAQERVTVGTMREIGNGALFLAAAQKYFKEEGLDVDMTAYKSDKDVADGVASGATDFGVGGFTPAAFSYASRGFIKAIAGQAREKKSYEGNEILVSNAAFAQGLRKLEDLPSRSVGITEFGTASHYQIAQIARAKKIKFDDIRVRPMHTLDALSKALGTGQVDAAILPGQYAREMLVAGQAKLLGWLSEFDEPQLGAVFAGAKTIAGRREAVEKFVRAYRRGAADYTGALMRHDASGKRMSNARSREVSTLIARYVFPGRPIGTAAATVEASAYYMEPTARLDAADIARQVEWYKAQGLLDASVDAGKIVDPSFVPAGKP